jgi:hypothetical protein
MRLTPIAPADLTPEQRDDMREGIAKSFKGSVAIRDDGALLGPWNPWLHAPSFGKASWDLVRALVPHPACKGTGVNTFGVIPPNERANHSSPLLIPNYGIAAKSPP